MNKEDLKRGFGCLVLILLIIGASFEIYNMINKNMAPVEKTTNEVQEEVPLQEAVGENEIIATTTSKKKVVKKKVVKKKVVKKKTTKKIVKKKTIKKVNLNANGSTSEIKQYAHQMLLSWGWSEYDWQCLIKIVNHESGWNPNAVNKSSGACGLFQSLPCRKMASAGADYRTNYKTQVKWGLGYIKGRYGTPAKAWAFWQKHHWY